MEEIELTYLAGTLPAAALEAPSKDMLDIYLPSTAEHSTLRIRCAGDRLEMTKKKPVSGNDSSHQIELTIPLAKEEYAELERSLPGKRVSKRRYLYQENGISYEIDVFKDGLEGLVLVDIEFKTLDEKRRFVAPSWCMAEVTQEAFIAGGMLAGKSYDDIAADLARFGYKKH